MTVTILVQFESVSATRGGWVSAVQNLMKGPLRDLPSNPDVSLQFLMTGPGSDGVNEPRRSRVRKGAASYTRRVHVFAEWAGQADLYELAHLMLREARSLGVDVEPPTRDTYDMSEWARYRSPGSLGTGPSSQTRAPIERLAPSVSRTSREERSLLQLARNPAPAHLVEMSSGERWEDPSADLIFELLADIEKGDEEWLIIGLTADMSGRTFAQAARNDDGTYVVEYQEGSLDRHFNTQCANMRQAHRLLFAWTIDEPGWRDYALWEQEPPPH